MADDTWRIIDDVNYIIFGAQDITDEGQDIICGTQDITRRTRRVIDGAGSATDRAPSAIDRKLGIIDAGRSNRDARTGWSFGNSRNEGVSAPPWSKTAQWPPTRQFDSPELWPSTQHRPHSVCRDRYRFPSPPTAK